MRTTPLMMIAVATLAVLPASAARIENSIAVFSALDKVTARISRLEVPLNQTVLFGSLKVTPRACFSRPPDEAPKTTTFVEVEEVQLDGKQSRIFTGWMFAESPGLHAVEHPVFDVWLTSCGQPKSVAQQKGGSPAAGTAAQPGQPAASEEPTEQRRRRAPR
jgi:hypothetical protein